MTENDDERRSSPVYYALLTFTFALGLIQVWAGVALGFGGWPEWLAGWMIVSGWALSGGNVLWFVLTWMILSRRFQQKQ